MLKTTLILLFIISSRLIAQNAPRVIVPATTSDSASISVPIKTVNFKNISAANLKLSYNPAVGEAVAVTQGDGLPGMYNINLTEPGVISIGWYTSPAATITDSTVVFRIEFKRVNLGDLLLTFTDDGYSCTFSDEQFKPLNDIPYTQYFQNGKVKFIEGLPLGIKEHRANMIQIKAYPNPCKETTIITFHSKTKSEVTINLYDLAGNRTMQNKRQVLVGENSIPLELDQLTPNLYIVEVIVGNEIGVVKLVKEW